MERDEIIKEKDYIVKSGKTSEEIAKELEVLEAENEKMTEWPFA